ncbi:hypothetical protein 1 [Wenling sobemo-like virus 1]|uniref:hypothetical protein 1 n=1 Tax=Wenling sobemo-like virus 1 TaxID=1923540 RepID=UPI00090A2E6C|nr:hypothetical protein 1 [Wenling sobemo-like virus 1]APG75958.1 hypothetical protein 1 [Wenling sobemo-like virus 1]
MFGIKALAERVLGGVMAVIRFVYVVGVFALQVAAADVLLVAGDYTNYNTVANLANGNGLYNWLLPTTYFKHLFTALVVVIAGRFMFEFRSTVNALKPPSYDGDADRMKAYTFTVKDFSKDYMRQPGFTSESMRAGSVIHTNLGEVKGCLHVLDNNSKTVGFAQVVKGHIVMPEHVLMAADGGRLCGPYGGLVALNPKMFELVKTDVVVCPLVESHRKILAVKDADFRPSFRNGAFAQMRTTPLMDPDAHMVKPGCVVQGKVQPNDMFGMVSFSGSTRPGMSGGGYYVDGALVAMHLCGGLSNMGVSMGFVMESVARPEADLDTYEWLMKSAEYEDGFEWDNTHDPSLVIVKDVNNRYHEVDLDYAPAEFYDVLGMRKPKVGVRNRGIDYSNKDYEPEAKVGYDHQIMKTGYLKDPSSLPKEMLPVGTRLRAFVEEEDVEDQDDPVQIDDAFQRARDRLHDYFKNLIAELAADVARPSKEEAAINVEPFLEESRALVEQKGKISRRLQEINTVMHGAKKAQKVGKTQLLASKTQTLEEMRQAKEMKKHADAATQLLRTNDLKKKSKNARQNAKRKEQVDQMRLTQDYLMEQLQQKTGQTANDLHQQMLDAMRARPSTSQAGFIKK